MVPPPAWVRTACSPRSRRWSPLAAHRVLRCLVHSALAEVVPSRCYGCWPGTGALRARGDGPVGGPDTFITRACSPRSRRWSESVSGQHVERRLLSALAEVLLRVSPSGGTSTCALRARGGAPQAPVSHGDDAPLVERQRGFGQAAAAR